MAEPINRSARIGSGAGQGAAEGKSRNSAAALPGEHAALLILLIAPQVCEVKSVALCR